MNRRYGHSQRLRNRQSLRFVLALTATTAACLALLLMVVFNFSEEQESVASPNMIFRGCEVTGNSKPVFRGSINQEILCLAVEVTGKGTPLRLSSITFNANGTTEVVRNNVENARLWFTGNSNEFTTVQQVGSTVSAVTNENFTIQLNKNLAEGKNYFWLSFDVKPNASFDPGAVDAECVSLRIGALDFLPDFSATPGKRFVQSNAAYFSTGKSPVSDAQSWNSRRDGTGISPRNMNDSRNTFFVQSGHHLVCEKPFEMPAVIIEPGASLKASAPLKMQNLIISRGGKYEQGVVSATATIREMTIENSGEYLHNNTGLFPCSACTFEEKSKQVFLQYGKHSFPQGVSWGNVLVNSSSPVNMDATGVFRDVKGKLELKQTGPNHCMYVSATDTMNIGKDFMITGGKFFGVATNSDNLTVNVKGNLVITEGILHDVELPEVKHSYSVLNIRGNVEITGGLFNFDVSGKSYSWINFTAPEIPSTWTQSIQQNVFIPSVHLISGKKLSLKGVKMGDFTAKSTFTVHENAELICGKVIITGEGNFVLENNSTIWSGHQKGINSEGKEGNIQTDLRTFHSGANYIFYLNENPQHSGKIITAPQEGTIRSFTLRKEQPSQWLVLSRDYFVSENISMEKGTLEKNKFRLLKPETTGQVVK